MNSLTIVSILHLPSPHLKRWLATISAILIATLGLGAIAPTVQAAPSETTATVFSAPGWDYANVRSGPGTNHVVVNTIPAGSTVTLGCSTHGGNATGPYGTSDLWYKVSGTDSYIADVMILTGSDEAVTEACTDVAPKPGRIKAAVYPGWGGDILKVGPGDYTTAGQALEGVSLELDCWAWGDEATGPTKTSRYWYKLAGSNKYIAAALVNTGSDKPLTSECAKQSPGSASDRMVSYSYNRDSSGVYQMSTTLFQNYYRDDYYSGSYVVISWEFFLTEESFVNTVRQMSVGEARTFSSPPGSDMHFSLGSFWVHKTSDTCVSIRDYYDFDASNLYYSTLNRDAQEGRATEFMIYSSGCI